jgi:hypothetical protein
MVEDSFESRKTRMKIVISLLYLYDPTEMITSVTMNGDWKCPTPFYKEDWTHRVMYHVCMYCLQYQHE